MLKSLSKKGEKCAFKEFRFSYFFFYRRHVKHKAFFHDQVTVLSIKGTKQTCPWKAQTWHKNLRLTQVNTKAKSILCNQEKWPLLGTARPQITRFLGLEKIRVMWNRMNHMPQSAWNLFKDPFFSGLWLFIFPVFGF